MSSERRRQEWQRRSIGLEKLFDHSRGRCCHKPAMRAVRSASGGPSLPRGSETTTRVQRLAVRPIRERPHGRETFRDKSARDGCGPNPGKRKPVQEIRRLAWQCRSNSNQRTISSCANGLLKNAITLNVTRNVFGPGNRESIVRGSGTLFHEDSEWRPSTIGPSIRVIDRKLLRELKFPQASRERTDLRPDGSSFV